jgi:hypothetical protein
MKKFTKLLENSYIKYYEVSAEIKLVFSAQSYGEAGYLADSELGAIESHTEFRISDISEISKDEYKKMSLTESYSVFVGGLPKEMTPEQKILTTWESEFGSRTPTTTEKMEFYHRMREAGFDGMVILDTLKDKISSEWMSKKI